MDLFSKPGRMPARAQRQCGLLVMTREMPYDLEGLVDVCLQSNRLAPLHQREGGREGGREGENACKRKGRGAASAGV
jgi:hypothetical protein